MKQIDEPVSMRRLFGPARARLRETTSVDVISPVGIAVISFVTMGLCILIPPAFYEASVIEEDLMFLNGHVALFYTACLVAFAVSSVVIRVERPHFKVLRSSLGAARPNLALMVGIPLAIALVTALAALLSILHSNPGHIAMILSGRGEEAKGKLDMRGNLAGMAPFASAVLSYAQMRLYQVERAVRWRALALCRALWWAVFFAVIATALVKLARYEAVPVVLSWLIVFLRTRGSGYSSLFSIGWGGAGLAGVLVLFSLFAALRGAEAFHSIMGYGPASFNHLAALLAGRLHFNGHGAYTFAFLYSIPFAQRFFDLSGGVADEMSEFQSQFTMTSAAGLNKAFIWVTSYGYYYADWGWGALIVAFVIGLVATGAWRSFNQQRAWGAVVYPWIASMTLLSMTAANITYHTMPTTVISALLLAGWDKLPLWKSPRPFAWRARRRRLASNEAARPA